MTVALLPRTDEATAAVAVARTVVKNLAARARRDHALAGPANAVQQGMHQLTVDLAAGRISTPVFVDAGVALLRAAIRQALRAGAAHAAEQAVGLTKAAGDPGWPDDFDSRYALYASTVFGGYAMGYGMFQVGDVVDPHEIIVRWHARPGACVLCAPRDEQLFTIRGLPGFPSEGGFGGPVCAGGPKCRCNLEYLTVTPGDMAARQLDPGPPPDPNVVAVRDHDIAAVRTALRSPDPSTALDDVWDVIADRQAEAQRPYLLNLLRDILTAEAVFATPGEALALPAEAIGAAGMAGVVAGAQPSAAAGVAGTVPVTRAAVPDLLKVGPKGYIHWWIYVGPHPEIGGMARHPKLGEGRITRITPKRIGIRFGDTVHTFDYRGETPDPEHFHERSAKTGTRRGGGPIPRFAMPPDVDTQAVAALRKILAPPPEGWWRRFAVDQIEHLHLAGRGGNGDAIRELADRLGPVVARRVATEVDVEVSFASFIQKHRPKKANEDPFADLAPITAVETARVRRLAVAQLRRDFAGKKIAVRVRNADLRDILHDGRMKTLAETGRTGARPGTADWYKEKRRLMESVMFGIPDDAPPSARPVYGYVAVDGVRPAGGGPHSILDEYGPIQIVLRDSVRSRTTASWGDSIDTDVIPSPVDNPSWESFNGALHWDKGFDWPPLPYFAEAQIHGGVTVEDIEEVVFSAEPHPQLVKLLAGAGVPYRILLPTVAKFAGKCLTCGCDHPDDDHGDLRHITATDLDDAAEAADITADQAAVNLNRTRRKRRGKVDKARRPYVTDIDTTTQSNPDYRHVLWTGEHAQLVAMTIPVGEAIGGETHADTDQTLMVTAGNGEATVGGQVRQVKAGDLVAVPAGVRHNVRNVGAGALTLYTVYAPPEHRAGLVQRVKPVEKGASGGGEAAAGEVVEGVSVAGLAVRAQDTGRVLMLQRALTGDDPAAGSFEFPGGHLEPGEDPLDGAKREWAEEVGVTVPQGEVTGTWESKDGVYQGFVYSIASEGLLPLLDRDDVTNPDDPDHDNIEAIAWWEPKHIKNNPAVREELLDSWKRVKKALKTAPVDDGAVAKLAAIGLGKTDWNPDRYYHGWIPRVLGAQGEFDSDVHWRTFPSSLAPGIVPGHDLMDARQQIEATEQEYSGIGRWFGPEDMAEFYGTDGSVLVGVRLRSQDIHKLKERSDASGLVAREPIEVVVVAMRVNVGGEWRPVKVPKGLTTWTQKPQGAVAKLAAIELGKKARDLHPESLDWFHGWVPRSPRALAERGGTGSGGGGPVKRTTPKKKTPPTTSVLQPPTGAFEILRVGRRGESGNGRAPGGQWGRYGASGVLVRSHGRSSGEPRFLLVKTGSWVDAKGKWQLPGGANDEMETPYQAAAREMHEEIGATKDYIQSLEPVGEHVYAPDEHWSYTTLAADTIEPFEPRIDGDETTDAKWFTATEIAAMVERDEILPALAKTLQPIIDSYPPTARQKRSTIPASQELTGRDALLAVTARVDDRPRLEWDEQANGGYGGIAATALDTRAQLHLDSDGLTGKPLEASARALRLYRASTYKKIGPWLRDPDHDPLDGGLKIREADDAPPTREHLDVHIALIDQALEHAPLTHPVVLWRGIFDPEKVFGDQWRPDLTGATWTDPSFVSTSAAESVARSFGSEVVMRLHVPAGVGAVQLDRWPGKYPDHTREAEVLIQRRLRFTVVSDETTVDSFGYMHHLLDVTVERMLDDEE